MVHSLISADIIIVVIPSIAEDTSESTFAPISSMCYYLYLNACQQEEADTNHVHAAESNASRA